MHLEIINPLDHPEWDALLLSNQKTTFFHSSHWARVLSESYRYTPLYFTSVINGRLATLIPVMEVQSVLTGKKGVALPFTDFCDPIFPSEATAQELWGKILDYGEKAGWKYFEVRGEIESLRDSKPSSWFYEHFLDLSAGKQVVYSRFRNSHVRNIKKSRKVGVEAVFSDSLQSMKDFCCLNCITRKMHGLPPQPFSFFMNVYNHIIKKGHGLLVTARYQGRTIAACIYFHFSRNAIYKYGASDINYQHLRPNNLVMWKAIEWYLDNGYKKFTFGRTDAHHDGLRQFKAGWGSEERKINYYRYDFNTKNFITNQSEVDGIHTIFFKKLPIPILKIIGAILYRHMG